MYLKQEQWITGTPEHPGTPEQPKNPETLNLTLLFCIPITDHVKKIKCQCYLFTHENFVTISKLFRCTWVNKLHYHSIRFFLPFHWPRIHHVTSK